MKPGDTIWVRSFKADGSVHRWWRTTVESATPECIVTWTPAGTPVFHNPERFPHAVYDQPWAIRSYYWPGRRHDLLEVYQPDGRLHELYINISSPVEVNDDEVRFIDHELDVVQSAGEAAQIVDQDEFAEAAAKYGYTDAFVRQGYELAESLLALVSGWQPLGMRADV